ncbi:hypothetical protein DER44DRAFT_860970 [Fusarium oxysporum]|nr:hypothetical protein DER44DRAFT_860970 [Fusarium oxysporum]
MAQDIFTLFLKRIALVLDSSIASILYPNLDRSSGPTTSLINDLAETMIAERLATRDKAIMTILPGFYQDSVFQYPLNFQLISVANSLKQQNRFDESEEIIERLIKTATVEDVWASEQRIKQKESAFGAGSDELFWALLSSEYDGMATMLFLLDVAQVCNGELKQRDQLEEVGWSTSQLQGYVRESYKQYNCVLTVASSGLRGLEYVQLLAGSRTWSLECLYEAVLAALDTGSLETLECLYSREWPWAQGEAGSISSLVKLLGTALRWGIKNLSELYSPGKSIHLLYHSKENILRWPSRQRKKDYEILRWRGHEKLFNMIETEF